MMIFFSFISCALLWSKTASFPGVLNNTSIGFNVNQSSTLLPVPEQTSGFADAAVNTQILTVFLYNNQQVYVYSAVSNQVENSQSPEKWLFFYAPLLIPMRRDPHDKDSWAWASKNEVRVRLMLGDQHVEDAARKAIKKKYNDSYSNYSSTWDVAPLMIDSLTAYIVKSSDSPAEGIHPFKTVHPNEMAITFRFRCSNEEVAQAITQELHTGNYEVEIAFFFAGFRQIKVNAISITGEQLKSVMSKTSGDGGNTNPTFIHRTQASKFVGKYVANVRKMIYFESPDTNTTQLTQGLDDQFLSLLYQGMEYSEKTMLSAKSFEQVWSSDDLNPDRITSEVNKIFRYNQSETARHNFSDTFYSLDHDALLSLEFEASAGGSVNTWFGSGEVHASTKSKAVNADSLKTAKRDIYSMDDMNKMLAQDDLEMQWDGEKILPKSFNVFKLTDITDSLQVALVSKQFVVDNQKGAITRRMSIIDSTTVSPRSAPWPILTGTIQLYAGLTAPPEPWLLCDGSQVSQRQYKKLYAIIGNSYASTVSHSNNITIIEDEDNATFTLPDLRGRFPLGTDIGHTRFNQADKNGITGGSIKYSLSAAQLPAHRHGLGTLTVHSDGKHNHSINDPGHNHGGLTQGNGGPVALGGSSSPYMAGSGRNVDVNQNHNHGITKDYSGVSIQEDGRHTHILSGETGDFGIGQQFDVIPPYLAVNYIIYAGD